MKNDFTFQEIANWQLTNNSFVELPTIQRGFVWKPKQVEDLWDSILRGFPIGSFLFSKSGEKLYLMDGQQRATSIFIGHFNPYNSNSQINTWSIKGKLPVLWIDIKPDTLPDSSKYLFRLVTRSHPWGYQATNNDKKLSVSDRRKVLDKFKQNNDNESKGYTSFENTSVFPFDCSYPIPFCFFLESNDISEVISKCEQYLPEYISTKREHFQNKTEFLGILKNDLSEDLKRIFENVQEAKKVIVKSNVIEDKVLNEENKTEDPTLFVRMNSAGTTLTGDDLIYSIYKANFPDAKNLIENIGLNFIAPTQVLSLVSRIVSSELDNNKFTRKMNVRDFQRKIKDDKFKKRLEEVIASEEIKNLFIQSISILSCKDNELFKGEIPPIIIKQLIRKNQDLYLFFLYWLHINKDVALDDSLKLKLTAKLIAFSWFNFANLPRLWSGSEHIPNKEFWKEPLNKLMWWDNTDGIHFLLPPNLLREYYQQEKIMEKFKKADRDRWNLLEEGVGKKIILYYEFVKKEKFDSAKSNDFFVGFIERIRNNKQMILFAQREYINSTFGDFNQLDELEDTNAPWDWDHIYPSEWVYNMKKCHKGIREWNNSNGNFRAISLEHNRSRGNSQAPKKISDVKERKYSFIKENDWEYWKNIGGRILDEKIDNHFKAITTRTINIYESFWNDLEIEKLIDKSEK